MQKSIIFLLKIYSNFLFSNKIHYTTLMLQIYKYKILVILAS